MVKVVALGAKLLGEHFSELSQTINFKFITGALSMPDENDELFEAWKKCNVIVLY